MLPGTSAEFAEATDDQLRTVKCIGHTLGLKPAVAEAAGKESLSLTKSRQPALKRR